MHDPHTVAFEIPNLLVRKSKWGYRPALITIWHVDPETDGSDDSCGYSCPKLGDAEKKVVDEMLSWEKKSPYYFSCLSYFHNPEYQCKAVSPGDCLSLCITGIGDVAWKLDERRMDSALMSLAVSLATNPVDNLQAAFAAEGNTDYQIEQAKRGAFRSLVRCYMRERRQWWQHPKWHLRHWEIRVHPIQSFKRWAFSRCKWCQRGFRWGEEVLGYSWNAGGPRWFRSETDISHLDCDKNRKPMTEKVPA